MGLSMFLFARMDAANARHIVLSYFSRTAHPDQSSTAFGLLVTSHGPNSARRIGDGAVSFQQSMRMWGCCGLSERNSIDCRIYNDDISSLVALKYQPPAGAAFLSFHFISPLFL